MKATKEDAIKLGLIADSVEVYIERNKINLEEHEGFEFPTIVGITLLFQEKEYCLPIKLSEVENFDDVDVYLTIYYQKFLSDKKKAMLGSFVREKLKDSGYSFNEEEWSNDSCEEGIDFFVEK